MNYSRISLATLAMMLTAMASAAETSTVLSTLNRSPARTSFQSADPYGPQFDVRSDVAIAYGVNDTLTSRVAEWRSHGYRAEVMTGVAWGEYEEYIDGRFDGQKHADDGQVDPHGNVIWHHPGVPYMVPTDSFVKYLCSLAEQAVDAGAEALHMEEPEFWSRAGYSEGFKRLWQKEYGEAWQRPDSSPDAYWRSSKLKYLLYKRTLEKVFAHTKAYARGKGRDIKCYVPTHSLVSYAQWAIVSPESSLMDLANCDGYIAQVWTGTARSPNRYQGVMKERTFETAFLEYASMHAMTAPTGRRVYFLADPVEDDPKRTWDDYKANYEKVMVASLLYPDVHHYEVMPWPSRVFLHKYPAGTYAKDAYTTAITIPPTYASELMVVVNALNEMEQPDYAWNTDAHDVAVLMSDTMMFQRQSPWSTDGAFDELFGLAMPLVKVGIPVRNVILERINDPRALTGISVIVMSYDAMKPLTPEANQRLAAWVKDGGVLIYRGSDDDAFHEAREWWKQDGTTSDTARTDLFKQLGVAPEIADGTTTVGKGMLTYRKAGAGSLANDAKLAEELVSDLEAALRAKGRTIHKSNHLGLQRGPFVCGGVLDESTTEPVTIPGAFVNMFSSDAEIIHNPAYNPGQVYLLRKVESGYAMPQILAATARCEATTREGNGIRFVLRGPIGTPGVVRIGAPRGVRVQVGGKPVAPEWDSKTSTFRLRFTHTSGGTTVSILPDGTLLADPMR